MYTYICMYAYIYAHIVMYTYIYIYILCACIISCMYTQYIIIDQHHSRT